VQAHCVFFDPVSGEMFLLLREKEKKAKETLQGVLFCASNFILKACLGEKINLFLFYALLHKEMAWKFFFHESKI